MKLKDAINLANKRDHKPLLKFNAEFTQGLGTPDRVLEQYRASKIRRKILKSVLKKVR